MRFGQGRAEKPGLGPPPFVPVGRSGAVYYPVTTLPPWLQHVALALARRPCSFEGMRWGDGGTTCFHAQENGRRGGA